MKAEISESFKHKLDLNAGSEYGSFLTVNTTRLNYNNHSLIWFNNNNNKLQLRYHPGAVVGLHAHKYEISNWEI